MITKQQSQQAGHYEIHGETIAKFEFFENGFNPYSRYLDIEKVDLILRKNIGNSIKYYDIQVKYGRLYECGIKWEKLLNFDVTSWRFFKPNEFINSKSLFIAYVLSLPGKYNGDIFIFPALKFNEIINKAISCNTKKGKRFKVYIARNKTENKWYLWKKRPFDKITTDTCLELTEYWRNFKQIGG